MAHKFQTADSDADALCVLTEAFPKDARGTRWDPVLAAIQEHMIYSETDARGRITHINPAFCALSGYSKEELIGSFHNIVSSGTHDSDFWKRFWKTIRSGKAWHGEVCNRAKDGSIYWVDSVILPLRGLDGKIERFVSIRRDVSDQKRGEHALSRMGRVVEHSANEVFVFDAQSLHFMLVNRGARDNLGYEADELSCLTPVDIKPEFDEPTFRKMVAPLIDGTEDMLSFQTVHQRKDGSRYPCDIALHYARNENPPIFLAFVQDITQRRDNEEKMRHLALFDPLTELANRAHLQNYLAKALLEPNNRLHLYYLDLDRFKQINDTFGHATGDEVLKVTSHRLRAAMPDARLIARLGGDEFVVLQDAVDPDAVAVHIRSMLETLNRPIVIDGQRHRIEASIGMARYPEDCTSTRDLLQAADIAMYDAKIRKIGFSAYDADMKKRIKARQRMSERLALALDEGSLRLAFQPFVDLNSGRLVGVEALLRWTDAELGKVPPADIISISQEYRMLRALGRWVVGAACRAIKEWQDAGYTVPYPVSINVAAEQLEDGSIVRDITDMCEDYGVRPDQIEIELTENVMLKAPEAAQQVVSQLQEMGVKLVVDDFGTGYSSLALLMQFSVDKIKIDNFFVADLSTDSKTLKIVEATIALAKGMGCKVVAEGIENERQADILQGLGCGAGQGFFFDRPLPEKVFSARWLQLSAQTEINFRSNSPLCESLIPYR
ncbi:EAL domain-containing protein [Thioclava sp. BHET1]|nr:EAL domain-containing protein [Thioclava sp. BHET1]